MDTLEQPEWEEVAEKWLAKESVRLSVLTDLQTLIKEIISSRDTYWKERVDRAFVILDTNIQELVTYEERRVSKESVLTCVRRIKIELDNLK